MHCTARLPVVLRTRSLVAMIVAAAGSALSAQAQVPTLIDVNPYSASAADSSPSGFVQLGSSVLFAANDGVNGTELWITDGTEAGTVLLKDINVGSASSSPSRLTAFGSRVIFTANDGVNGTELWITDGTEVGTVLITEIRPGSTSTSFLGDFAAVGTFGTPGSFVAFGANDGLVGTEPWRTDGTAAGTSLLLDIRTGGTNSSNASGFISDGTRVYFLANDTVSFGNEQWATDGTTAGTVRLTDIAPGNASSAFSAKLFLNGWAYSAATNLGNNQEPWVLNVTTLEVRQLAEIQPGIGSSLSQEFTQLGNDVYFRGNSGSTDNQLFKVTFDGNGDPVGIELVRDINTSGNDNVGNIAVYNGELYFAATNGSDGRELWKSDGTFDGTVMVSDLNPGTGDSGPNTLRVAGSRLFFNADNGTHGRELFSSDGTGAGTVLLADLRSGLAAGLSVSTDVFGLGSTLLFNGKGTSVGNELFISNGTVAGTALLKDIRPQSGNTGSAPTLVTAVNGSVYFTATDEGAGREVWISDGTTAGTQRVIDANPGSLNGAPSTLTPFGNDLLFAANGGVTASLGQTGIEYYRATGNTAAIIADINPGTGSSAPGSGVTIAVLNGSAYFNATDGTTGAELWRYDGTNVSQVADFAAGSGSFSPTFITSTGGALYFRGLLPSSGTEPFTSDGTTITSLGDYLPGSGSSLAANFFELGGNVFLQASMAATQGVELAVYQPSLGTITQVDDIRTGSSGSLPQNFVNFNDTLYFTAASAASTDIQLYTATETPGSTQVLSNAIGSTATTLVRSGDFLYFAAGNLVGTNVELWAFDGIQNGGNAFPIEINASAGSFPTGLTDVNGVLYFGAVGDSGGNELYRVTFDGSGVPNGAELVADLNATGSSSPRNFALAGDLLFFSADDGENGEEIWVLDVGGAAPCPGDYNNSGSIDLLDLLAFNADWSSNLGQSVAAGTNGDYDNSGNVDLLDLLAFNSDWSSNLGQPCP